MEGHTWSPREERSKAEAMKSYPCIGAFRKMRGAPNSHGRCACCDNYATHRMDVQVSWFRGEDEVYQVCREHKPGPQDWNEFYVRVAQKSVKREAERKRTP